MDLLKDNVRGLYVRFLLPALGSALVISIYSFVDTIAVGQAESEIGSAAMAVILPFFAIMSFFAVLTGMGGAVLMSQAFGEGNPQKGKQMFTASTIVMLAVTGGFWALFGGLGHRIFYLFGADDALMPKVMEYARWLIYFFPMFVFPSFLGGFIRNDKSPTLVMISVLVGGAVNIVGDIVLVFPLHMGMTGAAVATVSGSTVQVLIMLLHFCKKSNNLRFVRPTHFWRKSAVLLQAGFAAGILDLGIVINTCLMNNQLMRYGNSAHLAVYGVISTIAALWQALYAGVGQAVQPIAATNYGADKPVRIKKALHLGAVTVAALVVVFVLLGELFPLPVIKLFMDATPEVLAVAPRMTRLYSLWYIFLGFNVFGVYFLQALTRTKLTFVIAALRCALLNILFLYTLPLSIGIDGVMLALPIAEGITSIFTAAFIFKLVRDIQCLPRLPRRLTQSEYFSKA